LHVAVWAVLGAVSLTIVLNPILPVAARDPFLATLIATLASSVGLALMQLGRARFLVLGERIDLFAGVAFGVLAIANVIQLGGLLVASSTFGLRGGAPLILVLYVLAPVLLVAGLFRVDASETVPPASRRTVWWQLIGLVGLIVLAAAVAAGALGGGAVPLLMDSAAQAMLVAGQPVQDILRGQSPWVLLLDSVSAGLLLVAAIGYLRVARKRAEPQVGWLALALSLLFFAQAHALLFPPVTVDYVSSGDLCELVGFCVLLSSLVSRLGDEIAHRASHDERLRLSRELHDGLAQQLALLHIRLGSSLREPCSTPAHARDMEFAARQVEAALLEARQAITALRVGALSWDEFTATLGSYVDEFADNHQVDVRLAISGTAPDIDAALQAEILRILHEAFSNALRHGGAQHIGVSLEATDGWLELRVEDDGSGLPTEATLRSRAPASSGGVGLASMAERVQRRGGQLAVTNGLRRGVAVDARLPLTSRA
jgi:signal transduction histidine kinase